MLEDLESDGADLGNRAGGAKDVGVGVGIRSLGENRSVLEESEGGSAERFSFQRGQDRPIGGNSPHLGLPAELIVLELGGRCLEASQELGLLGEDSPASLFLLRRRQGKHGLHHPGLTLAELQNLVLGMIVEREKLVVLLLRERVELVVVALSAGERRAEPHRRGGVHPIEESLEPGLFVVDAAFLIEKGVAVKSGRDSLFGRRLRQHVARDLLDGEIAEREVPVQRADDPVAILPHRAGVVLLVSVGVRVTREIEPGPSPPLSEMRGCEQSVHELFVSIGGLVGEKAVQLFEGRRKSDQIQAQAADPGFLRRLLRGGEAFLLEPREDESIDGVSDPCRVSHLGEVGSQRLNIGPMLRRGRRFRRCRVQRVDPLSNESDRIRGKRLGPERHRRLVEPEDAPQERASLGIVRDDRGSGEPSRSKRGFGIEAKTAFLPFSAVARGARGLEDRQDVFLESGLCRRERSGEKRRAREQEVPE